MKLFGLSFGHNTAAGSISKVAESSGGIVKAWADLSDGWYKPNWWQLGQDAPDATAALRSSAVYTCVSILAQEIARLRITHFTNPDLSGKVEMLKSKITTLLRKPNGIQTRSDFFLGLMFSLLMRGNYYAVAVRDGTGAVIRLIPLSPGSVTPYMTDKGEVYYSTAGVSNQDGAEFKPGDFVPQRDMLHIRLFTPTHPLIGVTPLIACMPSVAHGLSIQSEATRFFDNQSKPSGILTCPKPLSSAAAARIKDAWISGTTGINTGKVPVLDSDLVYQQISLSAADSQVVEQYSMTKRDIANVYRIPLYMVGEGENYFKTAEAAQRDFVTRTLGFFIEHIEASLEDFLGLDGRTEFVDFDVEGGIMRPEYTQRIEGLVKGVQGGIFTPNEARKGEGGEAKEGGNKLYMQRQMVALDLLGLDVLALVNDSPAANNDDDSDSDSNEDDDEDPEEEEDKTFGDLDIDVLKQLFDEAA